MMRPGSKFAAFVSKDSRLVLPAGVSLAASRTMIAAAAVGASLAAGPAQAQTEQQRLDVRFYATHPMNNQHDTRSLDVRFPGSTPGKKLDCDLSHDNNTNINIINNCHYVPR